MQRKKTWPISLSLMVESHWWSEKKSRIFCRSPRKKGIPMMDELSPRMLGQAPWNTTNDQQPSFTSMISYLWYWNIINIIYIYLYMYDWWLYKPQSYFSNHLPGKTRKTLHPPEESGYPLPSTFRSPREVKVPTNIYIYIYIYICDTMWGPQDS